MVLGVMICLYVFMLILDNYSQTSKQNQIYTPYYSTARQAEQCALKSYLIAAPFDPMGAIGTPLPAWQN